MTVGSDSRHEGASTHVRFTLDHGDIAGRSALIEVIQLTRQHASLAARLCGATLAHTHAFDVRLPLLEDTERTLKTAWERRLADATFAGFGALYEGRLIATLGVSFRRIPAGSSEVVWTPTSSGWFSQALCSIAPGWQWREALPPLYTAAASWLSGHSIALHFCSVALADHELITAWRALGFRPQGAFALLDDAAMHRLRERRPPHGIRLRAAQRTDAPMLAALLAESHRFHAMLPGSFYDPDDGDHYYPAIVRRELHDPRGEPHYIVAEEHHRIIGFASGSIRESMPGDLACYTQPLPLAYVDEVGVTDAARGRGIAAALVAALFPWFAARVPSSLPVGLHFIVNNPLSSVVWPHLGFRTLDLRLQGGPDQLRLALPEDVSL